MKRWETVSTTSLIRQAGERTAWDVSAACDLLSAWSANHPNAKSAVRIVVARAKGASRFAIERSGFIVGAA